MEFKLNEYRQGVTDVELLADVLRVAGLLGDVYLSFSVYKSHGKYSESTFRKRFGSWLNVLAKLGMRTERNSIEMKRIPDAEMISDLQAVAERLGKKIVTSTEYGQYGKFSLPTIAERFGTWANFVEKSGLKSTGQVRNVPDADLFTEIERIWISLGKQPTTTDMKKGISKYSLDTFMRRFGGWRNALLAFIEYVNADGQNEESENSIALPMPGASHFADIDAQALKSRVSAKRTSRNINLKLRFTVLQQDNFRCRSCGASPAKNPETELHVDHIVPWSKGGETEISNLQTLCSKCNLGKSNHEFC
ncbi:MAG: HNH endonuclease [Rhodocyclaceae bacterium]|nr:MAG: HNH endonuclease [Rhodocyclaceae bacterium]